ncbi:MAG: stage III sporulation protein AF [Clostridia bacterium]|nr:stage III sporulation protein AF [Clostridia bacterium]
MIKILGELVRGIAIIIILTTFIEFLMPNSQMRRYVQLILGLFVIITLLNPVMAFLDNESLMDMAALGESREEEALKSILVDAEALSWENKEAAADRYRAALEKQIAALARLVSGAEDAVVVVRLEEGDSPSMAGNIEKVSLKINFGGEDNSNLGEPIHPVEIFGSQGDIDSKNINTPGILEKKITAAICDFYNLSPEALEVKIINPN